MRKLALLRNENEHHYNLIEVVLQRDDLSKSYRPNGGDLSWESFKIDPTTFQVTVLNDNKAEQPERTWAVATPKGKSSPKNIVLWDGVTLKDDKYAYTAITLTLVPAGGA
jgi:hypothetical protein